MCLREGERMKYLVGAFIGAIIGYITNWLAIKMLFRPLEEKSFMGMKVPFTPGLIPKEKSRIAKSVGEAIGEHLLTKETMVNSLCSEKMNNQLKKWVKKKVKEVEISTTSIGEKIKEISGEKFGIFKTHIENKICDFVVNYIRKEKTIHGIEEIIKNKVKDILSTNPTVILENNIYISSRNRIIDEIKKYKNSQDVNLKLCELLEGKINELEKKGDNLKQIVPESIIDGLNEYIYDNRMEISNGIKNFLKEEKLEAKTKEIITNIVKTKLNPMIAMFVNADSIYEKMIPVIEELLDEDENQKKIVAVINESIDKFLQKETSEILLNLSDEVKGDIIESITNIIINKFITEEIIDNSFDYIERKINESINIEELINKFDIDGCKIISNFINKQIIAFIESDNFEGKIKAVILKGIDKAMKLSFKELFKDDNEKLSEVISILAEDLYNKFIDRKAPEVIEMINISKIVEDKINEFDVKFAEEIIIEIANKELRAITWLGALLGSIMGLLTPIIGAITAGM
jgi:uncharacterized membrane protein YheB (UPF0754 family)